MGKRVTHSEWQLTGMGEVGEVLVAEGAEAGDLRDDEVPSAGLAPSTASTP
ncbi:hypothetical protein [Streptomyces sp. H34-S4]|uniref:hypothetical protein n=1 Tax=Streptomyces sp. H34-S4 TaxID=2996463 RepID=UPI0022719D45|nr:hypothetical protein [Streptomyces sp. H34-S4]MCY0933955.1 hypothetical protein [Streptomyces sp. H34-S4]